VKAKKQIILAIMTGSLLALSFPPLPFFLLTFIAFVPIFHIFSKDNIKHRFLLIYLAFFIYHAGTNWWISSWQENTDPYLFFSGIILALAHPFFFMIPFAILFYFKNRIGYRRSLFIFPFIWMTFEWLHSLGDFSYPWLTIGNTQIYNKYWIQFIDVSGIWGASLLIVSINVAIYFILMEIRNSDKKFNFDFINNNNIVKGSLVFIAFLIVFPVIYSIDRILEFKHKDLIKDSEKITISLIQPNIDPWNKWERSAIEQVYLYKSIQDSISKKVDNIDVSIWSETAIPYMSLDFNAYGNYGLLQRWVNSNNITLITGFAEFYFYKEGEQMQQPIKTLELPDTTRHYITFNSALLLNPAPYTKHEADIYRKSKLTPFAERFPYADQLAFAQEWIKWGVGISAWGKGQGAKSIDIIKDNDTTKIGTIICIESIYPAFCTGFVKDGAEILSVITNDAWYNYTVGPRQHYLIAALRAIENRRYIARAANSGITGFISPVGESILEAKPYQKKGLVMAVPKNNFITFYVKFGDWLPSMSLLFLIFAVILINFGNKYFTDD
jgi:apolipoprotein N-acyltransferase